MKATVFVASLVILVSLCTVGTPSEDTRYPLYVADKTCACIRTAKETKTAISAETESGKSIYQVFKSVSGGQEMFRVSIGVIVGTERVKFWKYGVVDERDFNGDGLPDYSWYGGDDSGKAMYLFLSHKNSYTRVDILKTLKAAWTDRFHSKAPNFENVADRYNISSVALERSGSRLVLVANVDQIPETTDLEKRFETIVLRVEESAFTR